MANGSDWANFGTWIRLVRSSRPMALVAAGLVLGVFALLSPWFTIDVFQSGVHNPVVDFSTTSIVAHGSDGSYAVAPYGTAACRCATLTGTFDLVLLIMGAAVILGAAAGVGLLRGLLRGDMLTGIAALCGVLLLLAPALLAVQLPGAMAADRVYNYGGQEPTNWQTSFIGQNSTQATQTLSWGPSAGWVLSLLGGIVVLVGVILARRKPRTPVATAVPSAPAQAAQAAQTAQTAQAAQAPPPAAPSTLPPAAPAGGGSPAAPSAFPTPSVGGEKDSSGGQ